MPSEVVYEKMDRERSRFEELVEVMQRCYEDLGKVGDTETKGRIQRYISELDMELREITLDKVLEGPTSTYIL